VRKTTRGLNGQRQYVDRTPHGRVSQNNRGQRSMEKVRPWYSRTAKEQNLVRSLFVIAARGPAYSGQ